MSGRELSKSLTAAAQRRVDSTPSAGWPVGHNSVLSDVDEYVIAAPLIGHQKCTEETPSPGHTP